MRKLLGLVLFFSFMFVGFSFVNAQTSVKTIPTTSVSSITTSNTVIRPLCSGMNMCIGINKPEVKTMQEKLMKLKYFTGTVNGIFDTTTASAVKAFQVASGLVADGIAGPRTLAVIEQRYMSLMTPAVSSATASSQITQDSSVAMGGSGPVVTPIGGTSCSANSAPSITVTAPNGGEVFTAGQQITVKWKDCNIPDTATVNIYLNYFSGQGATLSLASFTINDGTEILTLPATAPNGMQFGQHFKVTVAYINNVGSFISDLSNNLFTINGGSQSSQCDASDVNVAIDSNTPEGVQPINQFNVLRFSIDNESGCDIRLEDIDVAYMTTDTKPYFDEIQVRDANTNAFLGENDELLIDPNFYLGEQIEIEVHNAAPASGALLIPDGTAKELVLRLVNFEQPSTANISYQEYLHKYLMFGFHDGGDFDFKWANNNTPFTVQLENNTWGKRVRIPTSSL